MTKGAFWRIGCGGVALVIAFVLGRFFAPSAGEHDQHGGGDAAAAESGAATIWTCSMHPQVRQPDPGKCPICAMDLIPVKDDDDGSDDGDLPRLRLSERAVALMAIQTAPVQRREAHTEVRLPGRVAVDETRRSVVAAWFAGRIDRLYVDFVGTRVRVGEHLAEMYSPQLYGAQEEFLQALQRQSAQASAGDAAVMAEAAATKLRLLGLSDRQVDHIRTEGKPMTHLTYFSPLAGTVLERMVTAGEYVETGTPMYAIADLSQVWVNLEAYESELKWLRYGQEVTIEATAFPGEVFSGRIGYIDPEVDLTQRTARVRVNLQNEDRQLKPGMLVTGTVKVRVGEGGEVFDPALAGRWISPMHPEIVKDGPGECDICGMDLVPVEELGYFAASSAEVENPLLIPATAPLLTGRRGIVYVRLPDTDRPTFEARTVELGHRLGDAYPVISGLEEGELVVTHGQFKIDSELQIRGRPSMMAPEVEVETEVAAARDPRDPPQRLNFSAPVEAEFSEQLIPLVEAYLTLTEGLADDDLSAARGGLQEVHDKLLAIGEHRLSGDAHSAWMEHYNGLHALTHVMAKAEDIEGFRNHLQALTHVIESIYINFGGGLLPPVNRAFCPMVDGDQIGTWLQTGDVIANPYWGDSMLRCGDIIGPLANGDAGE